MNLESLVENLRQRQQFLRADRNIYTYFLKDEDPKKLILYSFGHILKGLERKSTLVDLAVTIGRRVRQKLRMSRNSVAACQVGWFILVSFLDTGLLTYEMKHSDKKGRKSKYLTYFIRIKNRQALMEIWDSIEKDEVIDLFPSLTRPDDWTTGLHTLGYGIVKKSSTEILKLFHKDRQPIVFSVLNKQGAIPWFINKPVFEIYQYFLENDTEKTPFKHKQKGEVNQQRKESLRIEAESIARLARNHLDKNFYHLHNYDFRGRIYVNTAL